MSNKQKASAKSSAHSRRWASFLLAAILVVSLGVGSGLAHGLLDGRWVTQPDLQEIGDRLNQLPPKLGDWVLLSQNELPESALNLLRCYGHTYRTYQNSSSGSRITVAVLFGPRGPIAVHTPEICYSSQGITAPQERQEVVIDAAGKKHTLWKVDFLSKVSAQPETQVYYAWSDGGPWQASKHPRFWLTDRLYKLQLAGPPDNPNAASECKAFLEQLLPALEDLILQRGATT